MIDHFEEHGASSHHAGASRGTSVETSRRRRAQHDIRRSESECAKPGEQVAAKVLSSNENGKAALDHLPFHPF